MSSRRVITVHLPITVVKIPPKTLISMCHRRCAKIIFEKNSSVPLHFPDCLGISSWMCGAHCWPVSESGTENSSASDSSSESPRFFVAGKNRADFAGSAQNTQMLERFFAAAEQFLHLLIRNWFLTLTYGLRRQCCPFSKAVCKCSNVESEGNDQWRLSDGFHC